MVLRPAKLAFRGQAAHAGGDFAKVLVNLIAAKNAIKSAPRHLLAQFVSRTLAAYWMVYLFIGVALSLGAQAHQELGNRNAHRAHFATRTAQA